MLLTARQLRKANSAKSPGHLRELAKSEDIIITEEESRVYFSILQKSKGLTDDEKAMADGCEYVRGHSCKTSGDVAAYGIGEKRKCMIITDEGPDYIECEIIGISCRRLGELYPEYAYLIKYLESRRSDGVHSGQRHWVWESHLKFT